MSDVYVEYYLAHHGKEGQKWGIRNGPPYPLDAKKKAYHKKVVQKATVKQYDAYKKVKRAKAAVALGTPVAVGSFAAGITLAGGITLSAVAINAGIATVSHLSSKKWTAKSVVSELELQKDAEARQEVDKIVRRLEKAGITTVEARKTATEMVRKESKKKDSISENVEKNNDSHFEKDISRDTGKIAKDLFYKSEEEKSGVDDTIYSTSEIKRKGNNLSVTMIHEPSNESKLKTSKETARIIDKTLTDNKINEIKDHIVKQFEQYGSDQELKQLRNNIRLYGVSVTADKKNGATCEVHFEDPTYNSVAGNHSLDVEIDPKTGKIMYFSMNG